MTLASAQSLLCPSPPLPKRSCLLVAKPKGQKPRKKHGRACLDSAPAGHSSKAAERWGAHQRTPLKRPLGLPGTLWLGNAAYLYLSVSFIQMLKALMPVAVFCSGCAFGIETFTLGTLANMVRAAVSSLTAYFGTCCAL